MNRTLRFPDDSCHDIPSTEKLQNSLTPRHTDTHRQGGPHTSTERDKETHINFFQRVLGCHCCMQKEQMLSTSWVLLRAITGVPGRTDATGNSSVCGPWINWRRNVGVAGLFWEHCKGCEICTAMVRKQRATSTQDNGRYCQNPPHFTTD